MKANGLPVASKADSTTWFTWPRKANGLPVASKADSTPDLPDPGRLTSFQSATRFIQLGDVCMIRLGRLAPPEGALTLVPYCWR